MSKKIGINQPYLFPYRGYFELINAVDAFVVYDDAKYMKASWINRNYYPEMFTFRLRKHSDYDQINECYFYDIEEDKKRFLEKTKLDVKPYLSVLKQTDSLSENIISSLKQICAKLGITTPFYRSSLINHRSFSEGICDIVNELGGDTYINLPGGKNIYHQDMFGDIKLEFLETTPAPSILCEL